jgi:hypothetical protein
MRVAMDANRNNCDFKAAFDMLVADLHKQFGDIKEHISTINNRLMNIEQHSGPEESAALLPAPNARRRQAAAAKLEANAKKAMKEAGRAFLKQQK